MFSEQSEYVISRTTDGPVYPEVAQNGKFGFGNDRTWASQLGSS